MVTITQLPNAGPVPWVTPNSGNGSGSDTYTDTDTDNDTDSWSTGGPVVIFNGPPRAFFVVGFVAVVFYLLGRCQKG